MNAPSSPALFAASDLTWPAENVSTLGPFTLRHAPGAGGRGNCATADKTATITEIDAAIAAMHAQGGPRLFMNRQSRDAADFPHDDALDATLASRGYIAVSATVMMVAPATPLAALELPRVRAFTVWEPLAIQHDIWEEGGILAPRRAVMMRAQCPKAALLGRLNDHPACAGFLGYDRAHRLSMLHALYVLPPQRRQGMAMNALTMAARWTLAEGGTHIGLAVEASNASARALYAGAGFVEAGTYHYRMHPEDTK